MGTSGGAEADMFDSILRDVIHHGFTIQEIVTDKDTSSKSIYLPHFPEGRISNHCSKTLHHDLQAIKQMNEICSNYIIEGPSAKRG